MAKDMNRIEEAVLGKIQQRVHSRTTEETFLARALRHHDLSGAGFLDLDNFTRAMLPYTAGVSDKDVRAIFDRYAEEGLLPIRAFAHEFTSGVRREADANDQVGFALGEEKGQGQGDSEAPEEVLERLRDYLYEQGPRGITSLAAAMRDADPQNARVITFDVFQKVLSDAFGDLQVDAEPLFDLLRQPHVHLLPYDEFLLALKEEPGPPRRAAIRGAFRRLDVASEGLVDLTVMLRAFNAQRHPQVSAGIRTAEEVREEFADTLKDHVSFRRGQRSYPTNLVAWEEFEDYYKSISGCFPSDEEFCGLLEKVWDLNKAPDASVEGRVALARPAAGAPAKVRTGLHHWQTNTLPTTVTHHKVELVTQIGDVMQRARALIARRGLRAAVDVVQHFYAADDDVDDQLDTYEFRQACRKAGLGFREAEEVSVFEACAATKGKIQLPAFFKLLHGELGGMRRRLVERAFGALGGDAADASSRVSPAVLKERFVAQAHPLVVRGQLEPGHVLAEFLDTFSQLAHVLGGCENGMVSFADFLAYYEVVSSTVENDSLFDLIVQRVWDVPKAQPREAWADGEAESPRRCRASLESAPSPMAERRPPPHAGPSAYAMESPQREAKQDHRRFGRSAQASAITKSSIVFDERSSSVADVLNRLRRSIALRGLRGWLALVQRLQNHDYRRNGTIMRLDWQRLNRVLGLGLSPEDQELLFKELSQKKKGAAMDRAENNREQLGSCFMLAELN
ncbi:Capsl [Symbiodinium natans]|uniref:Capsl protein n=1 Tax=Symbiodinium natans TaxID=878477 RepID=A0A812TWD5_9DINO|nr:Capsl [Symbiodinium natans]